jgi:CheY-like chemotaxis protein
MLVELILRNLVSNAIRYTRQGGVLVGCRKRGDEVCIEVWDTGIGIAPDQHQLIFEEFHQLGNAERDRRKGLGLGLAIVQGLCRALDHAVSMQSTPGRGSVFRLLLPSTSTAVSADVAPLKQEPSGVDARLSGLPVLVVDDNESVRIAMQELLSTWGCRCEAVESLNEALASVQRRQPELVICDYRLRGTQTGTQVIAALRQALGTEVAAILVTGDTAAERLRDAIASGVPVLHKPVLPALLHRHLLEARQPAHPGTPQGRPTSSAV